MEDETEVPSQYSLKDWIADYYWFAQQTKKPCYDPEGMDISVFENYFLSSRKVFPVADYCLRRFVAAMSYLNQNREAINFGKAGVVGEKNILVSKAVVISLYRLFAARPDHAIELDVPQEVFQAVIKEEMES